ncbi:unnamed protein product [Trichogramma brassicae]|uniref:Uncharacterized protein n=1 Tax=Trichogramma brassicae TaxID=86971 RepID=A0A6H5IS74_9HYME|nr:unnamed protein product [Trichogramma brassicae]
MQESQCHFFAGWSAGFVGTLVGHPMDTIKLYQQMSNVPMSIGQAAIKIMKKDGIRGFYRGMIFPLLGSGYLNSLYFGICDMSMNYLQRSRGHTRIMPTNSGWMQDLFVAGCAAGAVQTLITGPTEFIKIRMQMGKSGGVYLLAYQMTRHYLSGQLNVAPGIYETIVAGGVAGTFNDSFLCRLTSWIPVVPLDTIKSRIQGDDLKNPFFRGVIHCSWHLYQEAGILGFSKGFSMIIIRSIPVNITILYGYELILKGCKSFSA